MRLCGKVQGYLANSTKEDVIQFKVEILSLEGAESAIIYQEALNRESLQSSIRRHFGLTPLLKKESIKEQGIADALFVSIKSLIIRLIMRLYLLGIVEVFKGERALFTAPVP